jgi:LemA protein
MGMSIVLCLFLAVVGLIVLIGLAVAVMYNRFITLRNRIDNSWSQIDVQLRRRYDLIPNLVETVKGYAAHESAVFEKVAELRSVAMNAKGVEEQGQAENMLTGALKSLFAVAEAYPDLKANQNFLMLQEELDGTESKIAYARQFYNDTVMSYNTSIQSFPGNLLAGMFGFTARPYFEIEDLARQPVKVDFGGAGAPTAPPAGPTA